MDSQEIFRSLTEEYKTNRLPILISNNQYYHSDFRNLFETMSRIDNKLNIEHNLDTFFACNEIISQLPDNKKDKYMKVYNKYRFMNSLCIKKDEIYEFIEDFLVPYMENIRDGTQLVTQRKGYTSFSLPSI